MILKGLLPYEHDDSHLIAVSGARAEAQMAFYLKRAFGDSKDAFVLNDLRLPSLDGSDAAQVDQLPLHGVSPWLN